MTVIYAIQHNVTKRIYVGKTSNTTRITTHFSDLKRGTHSNAELQADYDRYGNDFSVRLLENVPPDTCEDRERFWMLYFNTCDPAVGYNCTDVKAQKKSITEFPFLSLNKEADFEAQRWQLTLYDSQSWRGRAIKPMQRTTDQQYKVYLKYKGIRGKNDADVSKNTGIGESTLSEWGRGKFALKYEKLKCICEYLSIPLSEMFPNGSQSITERSHTYETYAKYRDAQGLNDSRVSKATGIAKSTFTGWKQGQFVPKADKLLALCGFLGIPTEEMFADE